MLDHGLPAGGSLSRTEALVARLSQWITAVSISPNRLFGLA